MMHLHISKPCDLCKTAQERGFGFQDPISRNSEVKKFCSKKCQDVYYEQFHKQKHGENMIDPTEFEKKCMEETLPFIFEHAEEKELMKKTIFDLSFEEMMALIEIIITNYQNALHKQYKEKLDQEVPF